MAAPTVTHRTAADWLELTREDVELIYPDGFDDVNMFEYLMDRDEFIDRMYQSVVVLPHGADMFEEADD